MEEAPRNAGNLCLLGGRLCLDFANTADWHASGHPLEFLNAYPDLVTWSRHVGILHEDEARELNRATARRSGEAAQVLARAVGLREAIYRIFSRAAAGRRPESPDLAVLNGALAEAYARLRIVPTKDRGYAWEWAGEDALDRMLWPVVRDAGELLTADDLGRVRECASDDGCGWLFVDTSRNRRRKWCDMSSCGNRAKAKRHYEKKSGKRE